MEDNAGNQEPILTILFIVSNCICIVWRIRSGIASEQKQAHAGGVARWLDSGPTNPGRGPS
jgi:hypothetical protein